MATIQYGLTPLGFVVKRQTVIQSEITTALQQALGQNINLLPQAVVGQIVGIFSEREALIWEVAQAVYTSQYPSGAEGTSVDNLLAYNNLRRLPATPTVTAPTNTQGVPGLVLYGTPGTLIPAGSIITVLGNATLQFTTDTAITIAAATDAVQSLSNYGGIPATGSFTLQIVDPAGNTLTTPSIPWNVNANITQLTWGTAPSSGSFKLVLTRAGVASTTATIQWNDTAATIQGYIQALTGYSSVTVTGTIAAGLLIHWAAVSQPLTTTTSYTVDTAVTVIDSLQAAINTLYDATATNYPYTDVVVTGSFASSLFLINFGAGTVVVGQPVSSGEPQNNFTVPTSTLQMGITVINLNVVTTVIGAPPEGIGSATCSQTGPNFVPANSLTVIGSPVSGWTSVTNPLDCITGTNVESDTAALTRRLTLLNAQANGPVQAIAEKVAEIPGVIQAIPFQNTSLAAQQIITFTGTPTAGSFTIGLTGPTGNVQTTAAIAWNAQASVQVVTFAGTPSAGYFTLSFGAQTTANIPYTATAQDVQTAIAALSGFSGVIVTGSFSLGFNMAFGIAAQLPVVVNNFLVGSTPTAIPSVQSEINALSSYNPTLVTGSYGAGFTLAFNGSAGGQPQLLAVTVNSLTGVTLIVVTFGRPGKSFEIVVNDNNGQASNLAIAKAILGSQPAGIESYGTTEQQVTDVFGNPYNIFFSRPTQVPIYIVITLQTDLLTNPQPKFNVGSIATIQDDLVAIGNAVPVGGLIIGFGTNGLVGGFNNVPGILNYTMSFGTAPNPMTDSNIQLQSEQVGLFETFNIIVSYE